MENKRITSVILMMTLMFLLVPFFVQAGVIQEWKLVNPEGVVQVEPMELKPHPSTLEGKTVVLFSNSKHNADVFLNRIGELLEKEVKGIKIIKNWEAAPQTAIISSDPKKSEASAKRLAEFKPDLVIASQAD